MTTKIQKKNAFAKLNLILTVLNKLPDNYHNIFSLLHKIDLCDTISAEPSDKLQVLCDANLNINENDNLVYKAAIALNQHSGTNHTAKLTIKKNIPIGAGLGGGSSNAATTLLLLNEFWQMNLPQHTLLSIASSLGADVPFFLASGPQWVYGKGELMQKLELLPSQPPPTNNTNQQENSAINKFYTLVWPNISINTSTAYQQLNRQLYELNINEFAATKIADYTKHLNNNPNVFLPQMMQNDFEKTTFEMYPDIQKIFFKLTASSGGMARLTGSGAAVFALYNTLFDAEVAKYNMLKDFPTMNYKIFAGKLIQ